MHRAGGGPECPDVDQNECNPTLREAARAGETGAPGAGGLGDILEGNRGAGRRAAGKWKRRFWQGGRAWTVGERAHG